MSPSLLQGSWRVDVALHEVRNELVLDGLPPNAPLWAGAGPDLCWGHGPRAGSPKEVDLGLSRQSMADVSREVTRGRLG